MFFYLKASSKDKKVLDNFVKFLSKLRFSPTTLKYFSKHKKRKFITILNSPHVNKTAQEQFEFRIYSKQFLVNSFKPFSFFLLLKKIINVSFPGLRLEVRGLIDSSINEQNMLSALDPDNVDQIKLSKLVSSFSAKQKYIQLFDCYGEIYLKNLK